MARKKTNTRRIDFYITETNYKKLLILCNGERTFTDVINESISGRYGVFYKTPQLEDPLLSNMSEEEKEKHLVANLNWLGSDNL